MNENNQPQSQQTDSSKVIRKFERFLGMYDIKERYNMNEQPSHSPTEQPGDAKHTPGPWTYAYNGFGSHVVYSTDGSGTRICEMQQGPLQYNAELIARAPALLSEVSTLRSKLAELVAENERLKAAVAVGGNSMVEDQESIVYRVAFRGSKQ